MIALERTQEAYTALKDGKRAHAGSHGLRGGVAFDAGLDR